MRELILVLFLLCGSILSNAQKKYLCEFSDTVTTTLPDSVFSQMLTSSRPDLEIPPHVMQQLLAQLKQKNMSMVQNRLVRAEVERTIITIDRSSRSGILTAESFDSLLYKDDEIFFDSASVTGFTRRYAQFPKKEFLATGRNVTIMDYQCTEYLSTDSTCFIWVSPELPDYINPGIRKSNIKGAVLGFELKGQPLTTKCVLTRLGTSL